MQRNQRGRHRENSRDDRGRERIPFRKPTNNNKRHRDPNRLEVHRNRDKDGRDLRQTSPEKGRINQDNRKWNIEVKREEEWDKNHYTNSGFQTNNFDSSDLRNQLLSKRRGAQLEKQGKLVEENTSVMDDRAHNWDVLPILGNHRSVEVRPWYVNKNEGYDTKCEDLSRDRMAEGSRRERRRTRSEDRVAYDRNQDKLNWERSSGELYHAKDPERTPKEVLPERVVARQKVPVVDNFVDVKEGQRLDENEGHIDPKYKILCVTNLHNKVTKEDLKFIFKKFGQILYTEIFMKKDISKPTGCGLVEYLIPADGYHACQTLQSTIQFGQNMHVHVQFSVKHSDDVLSEDLCVLGLVSSVKKLCPSKVYDDVCNIKRTNMSFLWSPNALSCMFLCKATFQTLILAHRSTLEEFSETCFNQRSFLTSKYIEERYLLENLYGLNLNMLQSLGIQPPLVPHVYVSGLSSEVDQKKLEEVFGLAGKIRNCLISVRRSQDCTYLFGRVEYEHPLQAVQAISMLNKQVLCNREISVSMQFPKFNFSNPGLSNFPSSSFKLPDGLEGIGSRLELPMNRAGERLNMEPRPSFSNSGRPPHRNVVPEMQFLPGAGMGKGRKRMQSPSNLEVSKRQVIDLGHSQVNTIIVKNLPPNVTSIQLRDKFVPMGVVLETAVKPDGMGMVRFSTPLEARNAALLMEGNLWNDYILNVHLCT